LKKALGRNTTARMPESTQPVTRCHFGIESDVKFILFQPCRFTMASTHTGT